jgi:hypothetical protein
MDIDRCPSCAAAVRRGAEWCTLCYADLRPAPAVADRAPYPKPSVAPTATAIARCTPTPPHAAHRPLQARTTTCCSRRTSRSSRWRTAARRRPPASPATRRARPRRRPHPADALDTEQDGGWPCSRCQSVNGFDVDVCRSCTAPFGADLATPDPTVNRRTMLIRGIAAAAILVLMVGLASICGTDVSDHPTRRRRSPRSSRGRARPRSRSRQSRRRRTRSPHEPGDEKDTTPTRRPLPRHAGPGRGRRLGRPVG